MGARTLNAYVLREVALFAALALAALVPLLVSRNLFQVLDAGIVGQLHAGDLGFLARRVAVMLLPYALPIAFLAGVLLAVGRMAADGEVAALRASGLGPSRLLIPVLALGVGVSGVTGYLMLGVEHRAQRALRERVREIALRGSLLEPGAARRLGGLTLFARERRPDGELGGVVLRDDSDPERPLLVVAERGSLVLDRDARALRLQLARGDLHLGGGAGQRIAFESFEYAIPDQPLRAAQRARVRPREMSLAELRRILERARAGDPLDGFRKQNPVEYELQIHRRFALPLAPALFGLVAVPLGLRVRRGARSRAALGCALLVGGYYTLLMYGRFLALDGTLPAASAAWLPNGAFGLAAAGLLRAAGRPGG